ncbi:hypothetical protein Micbo1qcDRAFT_161299 [Microdochium bolleyi]|uniref:Uncharacterized protein n=1 Tax=Microdochium bolleyi TaxID=196109 RepID=A0A136J861_9PEZI|nr:hypothetical protein Micbo1qcDRAFT_161299 [Microdochium bolleyi]
MFVAEWLIPEDLSPDILGNLVQCSWTECGLHHASAAIVTPSLSKLLESLGSRHRSVRMQLEAR